MYKYFHGCHAIKSVAWDSQHIRYNIHDNKYV